MTEIEDIKKLVEVSEKYKREQDKIQKKVNKTYDEMQRLTKKYKKIYKKKK